MDACSSDFSGSSKARSRTLDSASDQVPLVRNAYVVFIDDIVSLDIVSCLRLCVIYLPGFKGACVMVSLRRELSVDSGFSGSSSICVLLALLSKALVRVNRDKGRVPHPLGVGFDSLQPKVPSLSRLDPFASACGTI